MIFNENSQAKAQSHFVNTASIPSIKNGELHAADSSKGNYTNQQVLERFFKNHNSSSSSVPQSNSKRAPSKGSSAVALGKQGSSGLGNAPNPSDFMPSSATSFYAAQKQAQAMSNSHMFSNYQVPGQSKQNGLSGNKQGSSQ